MKTEAAQIKELEIRKSLAVLNARAGEILPFTKYTLPHYQVNWHHRLMAKTIDRFIKKEVRRLMIFAPPRHGKSELTSRRLPALLHGVYPNDEIIAASYNSDLASEMTIDTQRIIDSPLYKDIFPTVGITPEGSKTHYKRSHKDHEIIPFQDKVDRLWHYYTGSYKSSGVGGSFTGRGADWIILDDLIKNREEADSLVYRENLYKWYQSTIRTRLEGEGSILMTITRWHEDDLAGRLIQLAKENPDADQWEILTLPAIREDTITDYDPRKPGEALWPQKFPTDVLKKLEASGEREWSALFQQQPRPAKGSLFNDGMFRLVKLPEKFDYTFIIADTSYNDKKENDFTVFTCFGVCHPAAPELYIIDVWRKRIKSAEVERPAAEFILKHQNYGFRGAYIEPKGHGLYLNQRLPQKPYGVMIPSESQIAEFFADRKLNKVERANNIIPHLSNKKIFMNQEIPNTTELLQEVMSFPRARHDDFVDTLIDGVKFVYGKSVSIFDVL